MGFVFIVEGVVEGITDSENLTTFGTLGDVVRDIDFRTGHRRFAMRTVQEHSFFFVWHSRYGMPLI
jgi:hypothetical protein